MRLLKNIAIFIWRIWFYCWMIGFILLAFPLLLLITAKESWHAHFYKIARVWGKTLLFVMGFRRQVKFMESLDTKKSYVFCANHTSMIDIMLMLAVIKNPIVFVGKAELRKIPIFGFLYKRTCILVDRNSMSSRKKVYAEAQERIRKGHSICIFPEGGVPDDERILLDEFKNGAFVLAIEHQIPIVPISFYDCKKRFSYTFFSGSPGLLRVKVHPAVETQLFDLKQKLELREIVFKIIYNDLNSEAQRLKKVS